MSNTYNRSCRSLSGSDRQHGWLLQAGLLLLVLGGNVLADAPKPAKSGYEFVKDETRAMQDDEFQNPGFIAVERGGSCLTRHLLRVNPAPVAMARKAKSWM